MATLHFVLVHGACHGAWCWFKLKPKLESAGHRVTALDLAASGKNMADIQQVNTMAEYSQPLLQLLAALPPAEKVVLVGHSLGGLAIALAMDRFPEKVAVGVFLTAFMPDTKHRPSYVLEKYNERTPAASWLDTEFRPSGSKTSMFFGPEFLSRKLYQLSSAEVATVLFLPSPVETPTEPLTRFVSQDLELARSLLRPSSLFMDSLSGENNFREEGYGSVPRAFIVCEEDEGIPGEFQRWMIQNHGAGKVAAIEGADHMAMLSKPQEVCDTLVKIARDSQAEQEAHEDRK